MNDRTSSRRSTPISRLMIKNFRSIAESSIEIKPLTLIVGQNSAGKSSIFSILRLLVQAQGQSDGLQIELNGVNIELGSFADILRRNSEDNRVEIAFRYQGRKRNFRFSRESGSGDEESLALDVRIALSSSEDNAGVARVERFSAQVLENGLVQEVLELSEAPPVQEALNPELRFRRRSGIPPWLRSGPTQFEDSTNRLTGTFRSSRFPERDEKVESRFGRGGLPTELLALGTPLEILKRRINDLVNLRRASLRSSPRLTRSSIDHLKRGSISAQDLFLKNPTDVLRLPDALLYQLFLNEDPSAANDNEEEVEEKIRALLKSIDEEARLVASDSTPMVFSDGNEDYKNFRQAWLNQSEQLLGEIIPERFTGLMEDLCIFLRSRIEHLGPLRLGPQVLYAYGARGASAELGGDARYFAYFLSRYRDLKVQVPSRDGRTRSVPLVEALSSWASRLGVATSVEVRDEPGFGRRVLVRIPGLVDPIDWEKVGVGVSQVLPVLARVLVAGPESLTILEQPELHLHPEAQATLAELLLEASRSGRQLIIESHSDSFIRRIRRLALEEAVSTASEEDMSSIVDDVTFIFAERDLRTGVSTLRNVDLSSDGGFEEWPEGFADQSSKDALAILGLQRQLKTIENS